MSRWGHDYGSVNDLKIFYHRSGSGSGKIPLLLLHGYTDNGLCWSRVADDLAGTYDVILPDARGHGRTVGPVNNFSYEQLGADALAFIQTLELERPFIFGHSMGALTALIVAANAPRLVRGIVLEDPPLFNEQPPGSLNIAFLQKAAADGRAFQKRPLAERVAACRTTDPGWTEAEILPWAESKGEYNPEILETAVRVRMHQYPWRSAAARVQSPALLVTANPAKGGIVTPQIASEAAKLMGNCELIQIMTAGHCIHRDAYAETMDFVNALLEAH